MIESKINLTVRLAEISFIFKYIIRISTGLTGLKSCLSRKSLAPLVRRTERRNVLL